MSQKRETRLLRVEAPVQGAPGAERNLWPFTVVDIVPAICLPHRGSKARRSLPDWLSGAHSPRDYKRTRTQEAKE